MYKIFSHNWIMNHTKPGIPEFSQPRCFSELKPANPISFFQIFNGLMTSKMATRPSAYTNVKLSQRILKKGAQIFLAS
jgi:hypothetical protein